MYRFPGFLHFSGPPTRRPAKTPILDFALAATVIPRKIGACDSFSYFSTVRPTVS